MADVKGSWQDGKGYRKATGKTAGGSVARFWLGKDDSKATALGMMIEAEWATVKALGGSEWDADSLARIDAYKRRLSSPLSPGVSADGHQTPPVIPQRPAAVVNARTFHGAIADYLEHLENDPSITDATMGGWRCRLERIKVGLPDMALAKIDRSAVEKLVGYFVSVPLALPNKVWTDAAKAKWKNRPLSVDSIIDNIAMAKRVFNWIADRPDVYGWGLPLGFDRAFKVRRAAVARNVRAKGGTVKGKTVSTFSVDELKRLYFCGTQFHRTVILLALNCGMTQTEIGDLQVSEVFADRIEKDRAKTGVHARWSLWAETSAIMATAIKGKKQGDDAVRTAEGSRIVFYADKGGRTDAVKKTWARLCVAAKVRPLPFKYLRKTGADWIRQRYGLELAETYLAHSLKRLSPTDSNYSNPRFDQLNKALAEMRAEFAPMFADADGGKVQTFYLKQWEGKVEAAEAA